MAENLNKDFWERMQQQYPNAVNKFNTWLNTYREKVDWDALFNERLNENGSFSPRNFDDLPKEFQLGIIVSYMGEVKGDKDMNDVMATFGKAVEDLMKDTN